METNVSEEMRETKPTKRCTFGCYLRQSIHKNRAEPAAIPGCQKISESVSGRKQRSNESATSIQMSTMPHHRGDCSLADARTCRYRGRTRTGRRMVPGKEASPRRLVYHYRTIDRFPGSRLSVDRPGRRRKGRPPRRGTRLVLVSTGEGHSIPLTVGCRSRE
jgi:hypothetical protein